MTPDTPEPLLRSCRSGHITMSMADTPESVPRFERFRCLASPTGTVTDGVLRGRRDLEGPRNAPHGEGLGRGEFLGRRGFPRMKGIHCALGGRLGQGVEVTKNRHRPFSDPNCFGLPTS
jgi:hypothetical protein